MEHQLSYSGGELRGTRQTSKHWEAPARDDQAELPYDAAPAVAERIPDQRASPGLVEPSHTPPSFSIHPLPEYEPSVIYPVRTTQQEAPILTMHPAAPLVQLELDLHWSSDVIPEGVPICTVGRVDPADVQLTGRLLRSVVEVLDGRRPLVQIQHSLKPQLYAAWQTRLRNMTDMMRGLSLRSVHTYQPAEGVIEVCATVERGQQVQALVARLERNKRGWVCVFLRVVGS